MGRGWHGHHLIDSMMDSRWGDAIAVNDGEGSSASFTMVVFVGVCGSGGSDRAHALTCMQEWCHSDKNQKFFNVGTKNSDE